MHPPAAEKPSEIQWEQVDDAKEQPMKPYVPVTDVKIGVENSHPTFIPIILESGKSEVSPNTETAESQVTESEARVPVPSLGHIFKRVALVHLNILFSPGIQFYCFFFVFA